MIKDYCQTYYTDHHVYHMYPGLVVAQVIFLCRHKRKRYD